MKYKQSLFTLSSLQRHLQRASFILWLSQWLNAEEFSGKLEQLTKVIKPIFPLQSSSKHMNANYLGQLEPSPTLKYC